MIQNHIIVLIVITVIILSVAVAYFIRATNEEIIINKIIDRKTENIEDDEQKTDEYTKMMSMKDEYMLVQWKTHITRGIVLGILTGISLIVIDKYNVGEPVNIAMPQQIQQLPTIGTAYGKPPWEN